MHSGIVPVTSTRLRLSAIAIGVVCGFLFVGPVGIGGATTANIHPEAVAQDRPVQSISNISRPTAHIGQEIEFTASSDSDVERYEWGFGNGATAEGREVRYEYRDPGTYTVTLRTVYAEGTADEDTVTVTVERDFADVTMLESGEAVTIPSRGDRQYSKVEVYGVSAEAGDAVVGIRASAEPEILLYAPDGTRLEQFDAPTADSTVFGTTARQDGTYYFVARRPLLTSSLSVVVREPDAAEPDDEPAEATPIAPQGDADGTVTAADREDWFAVDAGPGAVNATVRLTLGATNQNNVAVDIFDRSGDRIGEGERNRTAANGGVGIYEVEQHAQVEEFGRYYVRVRWLDGSIGEGPAAYSLRTDAANPDLDGAPLLEPGEQAEIPFLETVAYGIRAEAGESIIGSRLYVQDTLLYSPDRELVKRVTDNAQDTTAFGATARQDGTYYVVTRAESISGFFSYQLREPDPFEPNQGIAEATSLTVDEQTSGLVSAVDTVDWFAVDAGDGYVNATVELTAETSNDNNVAVDIFDRNGDRIGEAELNRTFGNIGDDGYEIKQWARVSEPGTYYVRVRWLDDSLAEAPSPYVLRMDATPPDIPPLCSGCPPPADPDGDGTFEEINGDGAVNVGDAQALFASLDDPVVRNNVAAFDFNDDGAVNVGDAQALFADGLAA